MRWSVAAVLFPALLMPGTSPGVDVGGAQMPPVLHTADGALSLASCGVRDPLWIDLYATALYVPDGQSPAAVANPDDAKAVRISILNSTFLPHELPEKWASALHEALPERAMSLVQHAYARLSTGDRIEITYLPESGTEMLVNGRLVVTAPGHRVIDAILGAWAEDEPVATKLRELADKHRC